MKKAILSTKAKTLSSLQNILKNAEVRKRLEYSSLFFVRLASERERKRVALFTKNPATRTFARAGLQNKKSL